MWERGRLEIRVENRGCGSAPDVVATLSRDPGKPLRVELGTIAPGKAAAARIPLERPALPTRFVLAVSTAKHFDPSPQRWLSLPHIVRSSEAYVALAERIHKEAVGILRELTGRREVKVSYRMLAPDQYGYFASGTSVAYQNPFGMTENALRVNRAVIQASHRDELMRHAQMMLLWYVPHEVVHAFSDKPGWTDEFIANTIQPYLTARILQRMKDLPYTVRNMGWVYDRYVRVLRPLVGADTVGRIDRFARSGAKTLLYKRSVMEVFHRNVPEYVYFGARINQISWRKETTLERLVSKHLK